MGLNIWPTQKDQMIGHNSVDPSANMLAGTVDYSAPPSVKMVRRAVRLQRRQKYHAELVPDQCRIYSLRLGSYDHDR